LTATSCCASTRCLWRGAVSVSGSAVAFIRSEFLSTEDYAVAFCSTVRLDDGSMLLAKDNVHDGVSREMLYAAGAVTAAGSTLSFVRNRALLPRMLLVSLSLAAGAHLRVACNDAGGRVLSTAEEYAAAGFGDAGSIDVAGCDACDMDTYCYAPGTASASMKNGVCVCDCGSGGHGEACVPVGAPALPPAVGIASSVFLSECVTVQSVFVVPAGASEVTLRHVVLDGVSPVLYVPWMARDGVRIVVQNVSLRNGAVLYVMGGGGLRGAAGTAGSDESGPVELSVCDVEALNGALVLTGTFPAGSVLTVTDSLLVSARPTPLVYLPGSQSSPYAPVLVLSGLRLVRSVLVVSGVALVTVMTGGRTVVVDGAVLELVGGGVALDAAVLGGQYALYASARVVASGGAVLRVSGSQVYAVHGLVFDSGVEANASAVVVNDNAGVLTDGALLVLRGVGVVCVRVMAVGARQQHQRQASVGAAVPAQCGACAEHADAPRERRQRVCRDGRHRCSRGRRPEVCRGVPDAQRAGAAADRLQVRRHHRGISPRGVWRVRRRRELLCSCDESDVGVVRLPLC
ncbi:dispersed gene family protein 1 (DGF-1), partial [Trypanosoma cruzi]